MEQRLKEITAEYEKVVSNTVVDPKVSRHFADVQTHVRDALFQAGNHLMLSLEARFWKTKFYKDELSEEATKEYVADVPLSWWQHFKRDVLGLACKSVKVPYRKMTIRREYPDIHLCPHLVVDSQQSHLRFLAGEPAYQ